MLSKFVQQMQEAATLRMAQLARDLQAEGHDIINLTIGEPDFVTPAHIREAAKSALDAGRTQYSPVAGLPELKKAICTKLSRDNRIAVEPEQVVVSNGAKQSIVNACLALLDPGDEVLLPAPYWVSYIGIIKMAGGLPIVIEAGVDQDFKVTPKQLQGAVTAKTKLLLFSNPCNPTGAAYDAQELAGIARVLEPHARIFIISDEIYEYINFSGRHASIGAIPAVRERTITVNGFSKGFAMTGWRLGYLAAPQWLAAACTMIQGQVTSGACTFNQVAAVRALLEDLRPTHDMRDSFHRRRDLIVRLLQAVPGFKVSIPQGAFYMFPDVSAYFGKSAAGKRIANADDFCAFLLEEAHVATVSGSAFGDPRCIRLSFAAAESEIEDAMLRIKEATACLV